MKKVISLMMALTLTCGLMAGCGGSKPAATEPAAQAATTAAAAAPAAAPETKAEEKKEEPAAKKEKITLRIGTGHSESNPWVKALDDFFVGEISKRVEEKTNYSIDWVKSYGGSVISLGNELQGTQDGLVDIGCIILAFEVSRLPLETMAYYCPFSCSDPIAAAKVLHQMREEFPEYETDFEKYNCKLLGMGISDQYGLYSTKPVQKLEDLAGMKIGAAGLNLSWIEGSGAVGVQTNLNETYQNLQTNVCTATIQPTHSCVNLKIYEVAPYYIDTNFNVISPFNAVVVNQDTWATLPAEVQEIIAQVGDEYLDYEAEYINTVHEGDLKTLEENNCDIYTLDWDGKVEWASKIEDTVHGLVQTLNENGYDGVKIVSRYYEILEENGFKKVRDWQIN